jgi:hypothetical protein
VLLLADKPRRTTDDRRHAALVADTVGKIMCCRRSDAEVVR